MSGGPPDFDALDTAVHNFTKFMRGQMLRVNVVLMGNAVLMGVMVGIGAYGHRYRHHPFTRFLFLGATILFLPIVSYIVSITGSQLTVAVRSPGDILVIGYCDPNFHTSLVLVWTAFVQIVGINTTAIVAADDREGRSIAPPAGLLVQALWTTYLGIYIMQGQDPFEVDPNLPRHHLALPFLLIFMPFGLIFAKIFFKYYAWYSARQSFSFGRNPRLIVGYMMDHKVPSVDHSIVISQHATDQRRHIPPPLVVSREDTMIVVKHPHGYRIRCRGRSQSSSTLSAGDDHSSTNSRHI